MNAQPQHRLSPYIAIVAAVSFALWLVIAAGLQTAGGLPSTIPQGPASPTYANTTAGTSDVAPEPVPQPGAAIAPAFEPR